MEVGIFSKWKSYLLIRANSLIASLLYKAIIQILTIEKKGFFPYILIHIFVRVINMFSFII